MYDAEFGPLTPEEEAWADAILDELGIGVMGFRGLDQDMQAAETVSQ